MRTHSDVLIGGLNLSEIQFHRGVDPNIPGSDPRLTGAGRREPLVIALTLKATAAFISAAERQRVAGFNTISVRQPCGPAGVLRLWSRGASTPPSTPPVIAREGTIG